MNATFPELMSYAAYVDHYAATTPDQPAVWHAGCTVTYEQLATEVNRFAGRLYAAGVRQGQRVAVLSTPRLEYLVSLLAAMKLGAVWLGLNPRYTSRELAHVLEDSKPSLVLTLPEIDGSAVGDMVAQLALETEGAKTYALTLQSADESDGLPIALPAPETFEPVTNKPRDPAAIVYTSGTSGAPKGAVLSHIGLTYASRVEAEVLGIEAPRVPCNLPINHVACLADLSGTTLVAGGMLALFERFDPAELLEHVETLHLTSLMNVPTVLQMITALPDFPSRDLSSLEHVVWGGAPLPVSVMRAYRERGINLMSVYGMTETVASITFTRPDADYEVLSHSVGAFDPGMRTRLADEDGEEVAPGEEGEVQVQHEGLFLEYFGNPTATQEAYTHDGWFKTGDVGVMRADGNLSLVGRKSDMIKSGGYNVYPREIELVIESFEGVAIAAVIPRTDETFGEVGVAYYACHPGYQVSAEELEAHCRSQLANYKVPKSFTGLDQLPLLPVGKVDKQTLKQQAAMTRNDA